MTSATKIDDGWTSDCDEMDLGPMWQSAPARSCAHWLAWSCPVSPMLAGEYVRVARCLQVQPVDGGWAFHPPAGIPITASPPLEPLPTEAAAAA